MPHLLVILDGYGLADDPSVSAIDAARKPYLDRLFATHPWGTLRASERAVGLPVGQMGNSEVGHTNLGAGRVVYQDLVRIDTSIEDETFYQNEALRAAVAAAMAKGTKLHVFGLFSDGGVHSHIEHLYGLLELAKREGLGPDQVWVHAFTDGRDTDPHAAGERYLHEFAERAARIGVGKIATVVGRYFAMDRDKRWERVEKAYRLLTEGVGERFATAQAAVDASYAAGITDEFVKPALIDAHGLVEDGDVIVWTNFRADRARQLTRAFVMDDFDGFRRTVRPEGLTVVGFAHYDDAFGLPVAFPKQNLGNTLGAVVANAGGTQLRAAETEKYPHVTFFFSGGREEPFAGEERVLIPSPKVATYDLQPEMSAPELADAVAQKLEAGAANGQPFDLVVLNFANPDMVGHTGVFEAAVAAIEAVDKAAERVIETAIRSSYSVTVLADHGNADKMRNPDGSPHTAHTLALVPHLIVHPDVTAPPRDGKLGDVAPTILHLMGLPIPDEMTGEVLV